MSKGKVLVVDDELDLVYGISLRLQANGYDVVTAYDGIEALHVAQSERPDLMVLDIGMPGNDGYAVAKKLKENGDTGSIPLIFLTARTAHEDRKRAYNLGGTRYLTKPCKPQILLETIEGAIKWARQSE